MGSVLGATTAVTRRALHTAAECGDEETIVRLLARGVHVDCRDPVSRTAMHFAALNGRARTIRLLAQNGADPDALDGRGYTPMMWSICAGRTEAVLALAEAGARVEERLPERRSTAMQLAAYRSKGMIQALASLGLPLDSREQGLTALQKAAHNRGLGSSRAPPDVYGDTMRVLLALGARLDAHPDGWSFLRWPSHAPEAEFLGGLVAERNATVKLVTLCAERARRLAWHGR